MIHRNSFFKNLPNSPFKETVKLFPYKTQLLRMADFSKPKMAASRRLEEQKTNSTYSEQANEVTQILNQEE